MFFPGPIGRVVGICAVCAATLLVAAPAIARADGDVSAIEQTPPRLEASWLPEFGIKTAAGFGRFVASSLDRMSDLEMSPRLGGGVGIHAMVWRYEHRYLSLGVQAEFMYSARRSQIRDASMRDLRFALNYLEFPISGRLDLATPWRVAPVLSIGVSPGWLESAGMKPGAEFGVDARDIVRSYDVS